MQSFERVNFYILRNGCIMIVHKEGPYNQMGRCCSDKQCCPLPFVKFYINALSFYLMHKLSNIHRSIFSYFFFFDFYDVIM